MPAGRVAVVTLRGTAAGLIVMVSALVAVVPAVSVAWAVKLAVPAVVGVPEIVPVVLRVRPGGSDPLASDQVSGGVPPAAASVWL